MTGREIDLRESVYVNIITCKFRYQDEVYLFSILCAVLLEQLPWRLMNLTCIGIKSFTHNTSANVIHILLFC